MSRPSYETSYLAAFDEYADALFRHASYRVSSRERAADLTQETFLKAWDYVRDGSDVGHWKGFLYRILNNLIVDEYRRAKEESLDALVENDAASALIATGSRAQTEERLDDELMIARIRVRIPELPEPYRVALSLRYLDGFSPKEIAKLLDISENVASVRIHRAVERLRALCAFPDPHP